MGYFAALDVSQEQTAICVVDEQGGIVAEGKVSTCPDVILAWFEQKKMALEKLGMETGPLAVWLWNELKARGLPIICIDARHANAALKMMLNKTDRNDAACTDHPHGMVQGSAGLAEQKVRDLAIDRVTEQQVVRSANESSPAKDRSREIGGVTIER